jgi:hypothetical protein
MMSQWDKLSVSGRAAVIIALALVLSYSFAVAFIILNYHVGEWPFFLGLPFVWVIFRGAVFVAMRQKH